MLSHNSIQVGDYVYYQPKIGKGSFSKVYYGEHIVSKNTVAIKKISKKSIQKLSLDRLMKEIDLLKELDHPNIVKYRDMLSDDSNTYIVNEYCNGGNMKIFIDERGTMKEDEVKFYFTQIKDALKYLIDRSIYHRDIKPQNILVHYKRQNGLVDLDTNYRDVQLKLADFGFAKEMENESMSDTLCGTPMYMAPEIVFSKKYLVNSDLWSVGIILFQAVYGYFPFGKPKNIVELMKNIDSIQLTFPKVSDSLSNLLSRLIQRNPKKRLSWNEFFSHPWFDIEEEIFTEELYGLEIVINENNVKEENMKKNSVQQDTKITGKMNVINDYCDRFSSSAPTLTSTPISIPKKDTVTYTDNVYKYVTTSVNSIRRFVSR